MPWDDVASDNRLKGIIYLCIATCDSANCTSRASSLKFAFKFIVRSAQMKDRSLRDRIVSSRDLSMTRLLLVSRGLELLDFL